MSDFPQIVKAKEAYFESLLKQALTEYMKKEADSLLPNSAFDDLVMSERHVKRMKTLFANRKRKRFVQRALIYSRKSAAAILIILGILFGALLFNPQVRAAVKDFIIEVYDKFTHFSSTGEESEPNTSAWYPTWLPDGFELERESKTGDVTRLIYKNGEFQIMLQYYIDSGVSLDADNELKEFNVELLEGITYWSHESKDEAKVNQVIWTQFGQVFTISSSINTSDLLLIAQSIKK